MMKKKLLIITTAERTIERAEKERESDENHPKFEMNIHRVYNSNHRIENRILNQYLFDFGSFREGSKKTTKEKIRTVNA